MLRCESRVGKGEARAAASSRGIGAEALVGMCGEGQQGLFVLGFCFLDVVPPS